MPSDEQVVVMFRFTIALHVSLVHDAGEYGLNSSFFLKCQQIQNRHKFALLERKDQQKIKLSAPHILQYFIFESSTQL